MATKEELKESKTEILHAIRGFGSLAIILMVVAVLVIGGIVYLVHESGASPQAQDVSIVQTGTVASAHPTEQSPTSSPATGTSATNISGIQGTIASAPDKTNWNLYTNSKAGFSFEYPSNYEFDEVAFVPPVPGSGIPVNLVELIDPSGQGQLSITIEPQPLVVGGPIYSTVDTLFAHDKQGCKTSCFGTPKEVQVNGATAIQTLINDAFGSSQGSGSPTTETYDFLANNNLIYSIIWSPVNATSYAAIATTFRFVPVQ
jgi:hypothetical protein